MLTCQSIIMFVGVMLIMIMLMPMRVSHRLMCMFMGVRLVATRMRVLMMRVVMRVFVRVRDFFMCV